MRLDFYCCSFWLTIGFVFGLRLSTRQFWLFPSFVCKALQGIIDSFDFCLVADFLLTDENLLLVFWLLTGKKAIGCFLSTGLVCCYSWCLHFWLLWSPTWQMLSLWPELPSYNFQYLFRHSSVSKCSRMSHSGQDCHQLGRCRVSDQTPELSIKYNIS